MSRNLNETSRDIDYFPATFHALTWFAEPSMCHLPLGPSRCSVQLAFFGFDPLMLCLEVVGWGDASRMPSRTSVWDYSEIPSIFSDIPGMIIWQKAFDLQSRGLSLGSLCSHPGSGSSLNVSGPLPSSYWNGTEMFPGYYTGWLWGSSKWGTSLVVNG